MAEDLIESGNIDLHNRPRHKNEDGSISTVRSMSIGENGQEILIPTISPEGNALSDEDAIDLYHKTGQHLGKFKTPEAATKYAEQLHKDQEKEYVTNWTNARVNGPNPTATNKTINYNSGPGTMNLNSEDQSFKGIPSRVITNMAVNVGEDELVKVPDYVSTGVEAELQDMANSGRVQLVTPVADDTQAVQFKRVAQNNGAAYGETEHEGQRYAVMVPNTAPKLNPTDASFKMADAIKQGYKPEEVTKFLNDQGYDDAQVLNITSQANNVISAREAGYGDEEIEQFLKTRQTKVENVQKQPLESTKEEDPAGMWAASALGKGLVGAYQAGQQPNLPAGMTPGKTMDVKSAMYDRLMSENEMSAEDLLTSMKVLAPNMASMSTRTAGFFGNEEAARKSEAGLQASRSKIIKMAADRGLELTWDDTTGSFLANTQNGPVPINESIWDDIWSTKGEIIGGVAGAVLGAKGGATVGSAFGPWGTGIGGVVGSLGGAAVGAAAGSQFDYMYEAIKLQEDMEGSVMAHKALTAAEMSIIGDVVGLGVVKGGGATMKVMKRVKDFVLDGNTAGAYKALKDVEFMSDDQAAQLVNQLQRVASPGTAGDLAAKSFEERAIVAANLTKPGTEGLVKAAASMDPKVGRAVAQSIDDRAKDLLRVTNEASGENLGKILREDLGNYVADVKNQFAEVKRVAAQSPTGSNFRFDYDKLAVQPVIDKLQKNIMDPAVLEKFALQAQHIRDMSDSRTFTDLLELRQLVNEFKFNKRITKTADFETLNQVIRNIDGEITKGAQVAVENPDQWLKNYGQARLDYAKMKQVEENVMYKALNRPGINEEDVTRNLARYIPALDGTFNDLMTKLPMAMRSRVENSVVDTLANKYTAGVGEGLRATNFPLLAKELNGVTMTTPQARQMKAAVNELADVFKNDVPLSQITGSIQIPKFQSYLTADPIVRAKYEIASKMFNYVKTLLPNKDQTTLALVRKTSKLLENPLNARSMRELMEETAGKVDVQPAILQMQQETARAAALGKDVSMPKVKLYGNGSVLSTKAGNGAEQTIPLHRIASINEAARIATAEGVNPTDAKLLDGILSSYGFKGVQQGTDRVRVLKGK